MLLRLTPKGMALCVAVASGLIPSPSTDEEMERFNEFWRRIEEEVIPEVLKQRKETEAVEAPVPGMDQP